MYLDPGFGSMVIQVIVAAIAAGGALYFAMKTKIKGLFSKKNEGKEQDVQHEPDKEN